MARVGKFSIPTRYNGIQYRSKLEASYAEYFDKHGMVFAYEPEGFAIDGQFYLLDFYLPEIRTAVEVKGMLDDIDRAKLAAFAPVAARHAITTVIAESPVAERLFICRPTPQDYFGNPYVTPPVAPGLSYMGGDNYNFRLSTDVQLRRCAFCGFVFFQDTALLFACQHCGKSNGNSHLLDPDEYFDVWTPRGSDIDREDFESWEPL